MARRHHLWAYGDLLSLIVIPEIKCRAYGLRPPPPGRTRHAQGDLYPAQGAAPVVPPLRGPRTCPDKRMNAIRWGPAGGKQSPVKPEPWIRFAKFTHNDMQSIRRPQFTVLHNCISACFSVLPVVLFSSSD